MSTNYVIGPLASDASDRAFPLARATGAALTLTEWRDFCHEAESRRAHGAAPSGQEEVVVARNAQGYVKGLCIYSIRDHATYGRLLDVPLLLVASAADGEGVAREILNFLRAQCNESVCSGVRFWPMSPETWGRRSKPDYIGRSDHGLFMPALASATEIEKALCVDTIGGAHAIDRFSR